jgi:hypothetical protein
MKGNKTNSAKDMLLSMDNLTATLKEETKSTIKNILSEAVADYMRNEVIKEANEDEEDVEYNETEVDTDTEDVDAEDTSDVDDEDTDDTDDVDDAAQDANDDDESEDEGDEWSEYDDYKVGDDEYDFTGENDSAVVAKVFKLLNDDDQVVVKQDGDKLNIVDNEAGTEYVIELNPDSSDEMDDEGDEMFEGTNFDDMLTDDIINEEDLGYTDNYQSKDVISGLSMTEPSKSGKSWSKGVPTGTSKPWAGKGKSDPYTKSVGKSEQLYEIDLNGMEELEEAAKTQSRQPSRKMTKWSTSDNAAENAPYNSKLVSTSKGYAAKTNESLNRILKTAKEIQNENKELKSVLGKFRTALQEAVLVNVNLGNITKLMIENATTQEEKKNIVERFSNEVKTVEQSKALYESIKRDFAKENKTVVLEKQMNVNGSSVINETKVYQSAEVKGILDLMNRMK